MAEAKKYTLKRANTGLIGEVRESAQVDDVVLDPGVEVELTEDQIQRLKDAGVSVEEASAKPDKPNQGA